MAAIVQSQQPAQDTSAARAFWQSKMDTHPNIAGTLAIVGEVAGWFLNGHFLVWLGQKVISISGRVAETALLFAVLWISGTSVAPGLIELFMSAKTMQYLVWLALIVLALIPEIILGNSIINAAGHWQTVASDRHNVMAWVWALLFTIPTLLFLILTALTLNALVSDGGNFVQASNGLVGMRCFAGWTYGLLALVYAGIGRRMVSQAQPAITPAAQPVPIPAQQIDYEEIARQLLPLLATPIQELSGEMKGQIERLGEQIVNLQAAHVALSSEPESEPESDHQIVQIEDYFEGPAEEPCVTPSLAPKVTRQLTPERPAKKPAQESSTNGRGEAQQKALRILKRTPDIGPTELSKRANISLSSAKRILAVAR
jgi:hypothetical protein